MPFKTTSRPVLKFRSEHEAITEARKRGDKFYGAFFHTPVAGAATTKLRTPSPSDMQDIDAVVELARNLFDAGIALSTVLRFVKDTHKEYEDGRRKRKAR